MQKSAGCDSLLSGPEIRESYLNHVTAAAGAAPAAVRKASIWLKLAKWSVVILLHGAEMSVRPAQIG
jgi:hypothetical protein